VGDTILTQVDDGIATVVLNRPAVSNAIDPALRAELPRALQALNHDEGVTAVVLTGAGRSFCAGQDLQEAAALTVDGVAEWQRRQGAMFQAIRELDKPCVAALNGAATGAGFQIALCADIRVAHPGVRLGQPEVRVGMASVVGTYMMTLHLSLSRNVELSLAGGLIDAARAHEWGLVHHLAAPDEVLAVAHRVARELASLPATAFRLTKQRLREMTQAGFDEACAAGARYQTACYAAGEPQRVLGPRLAKRSK
jgi:enoyl-CoA hydratase/carnithine racemase